MYFFTIDGVASQFRHGRIKPVDETSSLELEEPPSEEDEPPLLDELEDVGSSSSVLSQETNDTATNRQIIDANAK